MLYHKFILIIVCLILTEPNFPSHHSGYGKRR